MNKTLLVALLIHESDPKEEKKI